VEYKTEVAQALTQKVWPLVESRTIKPVIHATFPLSQAADAHRLMESSTHVGKIVLRVA
jgi:NADPH2:quinone reductase